MIEDHDIRSPHLNIHINVPWRICTFSRECGPGIYAREVCVMAFIGLPTLAIPLWPTGTGTRVCEVYLDGWMRICAALNCVALQPELMEGTNL